MLKARLIGCIVAAASVCSCGGGGGNDTPAPPAPPPPTPTSSGNETPPTQPVPPAPPPAQADASLIRFAIIWDGRANVTLQPLPGESRISTRPVRSVEFTAVGREVKNLSPVVNSQGQETYVYTWPFERPGCFSHSCGSFFYEARVTDDAGFSFTKYGEASFFYGGTSGAFSDYGTRTVTFTVTSADPVNMSMFRSSPGYRDYSIRTGTSITWSIRAKEGDSMFFGVSAVNATTFVGTTTYTVSSGTDVIANGTLPRDHPSVFIDLTCCTPAKSTP